MKTFSTVVFTAILWLLGSTAISAQQNSSGKIITITKRYVDPDGTETTETIVKKGKAAENFDVDKYLKENSSDKVDIDVDVEEEDDDDNDDNSYSYNWSSGNGNSWSSCDNNGPFLGVEQDSDEKESQPGLTVQVIKGSAADKAGLKTNDIILKINDVAVNDWDDLTKIVNKAKPGEQVNIRYSRNGKEASATATLTKRSEVNSCSNADKHGFLGVNESGNDDNDKAGVAVSIVRNSAADKAGLKNGDEILKLDDTDIKDWEDISDFMGDTKPGDKIRVTYRRDGQTSTTEAVAGEQKSWNWDSWSNNNQSWSDMNINIKKKDACLGVYTETYAQDNSEGARINDFTGESAAREIKMEVGDVITAVNGVRVKNHSDLWNEIAKYKPEEKVKVEYLRDKQPATVEISLKACQDNSNQIIINNIDEGGSNQSREFFTWNWGNQEQERMRERRIITIHKGEGDAEKVNAAPPQVGADRSLKLQAFKAFPNPTQGQVTVEFQGDPVATVVSLFDMSGRQLFREELNAFNGEYKQQFDLTEYAKGTIIVHVQQGEKIYTEQVVVH